MDVLFDSSTSDSDEELVVARKRRKMIFKSRVNMDFPTAQEFKERFRMSSIKLESLLQDIGKELQHTTNRNYALSPKQQLCVALYWLGHGGHTQFHTVGDAYGVSTSTVCRVIHSVVNALNVHKFHTVDWPQNPTKNCQDFYSIARMPRVCGCVDGTLIKIDAPEEYSNDFLDGQEEYSINCMVVCGPELKFYYLSARWPGSVEDARVLRNSTLCERFDAGWRPFPDAVILGHSEYPLKEWLIPPVLTNVNEPKVVGFNRAHESTRQVTENAIRLLKEKFSCLNHLRVNPTFAANIFKSCVILYNISREGEEPQNVEHNEDESDDFELDEPPTPAAQRNLEELIEHFA